MSDDKLKDPLAGLQSLAGLPPLPQMGDLPPPPLPQMGDLPPPPLPQAGPTPTLRPAAVVEDVSPERGPVIGGTRVRLTGQHLYRVSIVRFGGVMATTIGAREPAEIRVLAPAVQAPAVVDVTVENPGAPMTVVARAFTYAALPAPEVSSIAPYDAAAAGGTKVSVIGKNFLAESQVLIGDGPAKMTFIDAGTLEVVMPAGEAGTMVDVTVVNPDGKRAARKRAVKYR